jgi:Fe-S-cluster-containing hydrogenase component 2
MSGRGTTPEGEDAWESGGPTLVDLAAQARCQAPGGEGSTVRRTSPRAGADPPTSLEVPLFQGGRDGPTALVAKLGAVAGWAELRLLPLFDKLPDKALSLAFYAQRVRLRELARDEMVPLDGSLVLMMSGQTALARFPAAGLAEELAAQRRLVESEDPPTAQKLERMRRETVGPLAELAEQNLAVFEEGDLIEPAAAQELDPALGCYAVMPAQIVLIERKLIQQWSQEHPFMADRFRRGVAAVRTRLAATDGAQAAVADFFVRHGLSVSTTLRVRKIDACIECGACEAACETRYGVKRLSLNGRILGGLDFVDACHTCVDARCIDPCNFDAISFDPIKREILIKEDACTGCTLCARACPYDAIEMHDLEQTPLLQIRLDKQNALAFGEGTARKAQLRRIASKCDHCSGYEDQACISACPTGALIEVAPADVVPTLPAALRNSALAGFDRTVGEMAALNSPAAFADLDLRKLQQARPRLPLGLLWGIGATLVLLAGAEVALRKLWPTASLYYLVLTRLLGAEHDVVLMHTDYHAGCTLAMQLGWVGSALLGGSMLYVPRKRLPWLSSWGALQDWFDWHVVSSVIGAALVALHTAARLNNWVSIPFWSMILTVLSGIVGRYLATQLPAAGRTVHQLELDRKLAAMRATVAGIRPAVQWLERYQERLKSWAPRSGMSGGLTTLFRFAWEQLTHVPHLLQLRRAVARSLAGADRAELRREVIAVVDGLAVAERQRTLTEPLLPLFMLWKMVHVPMAIVLTLLGALHIALVL